MRFKKFLSTVCTSALLFSSIFPCNAMFFGEDKLEYKVCFVGDSGTGKTSICNRLKNQNFDERVQQTWGVDFISVDQDNVRLNIWDTSGQDLFHHVVLTYFSNANIVGIFLDVSKGNYTDRLNYWLQEVNKVVPDSKKIIVLSKTDFPEVSSKLEAAKQAIRDAHNDIPSEQIISCSAKTNDRVAALKSRMFELVQQEEQRQQAPPQSPLLQLEEEDAPEQPKRKSLTFWTLVTTGISAIGYGTYKVCKYFTSNDKDKNVNADKLKKDYKHTKVTA